MRTDDVPPPTGDPWTDSTGYGVQVALSSGPTLGAAPRVGKRTDQENTSLMGSSGAWTFDSGGPDTIVSLDRLYTMTLALGRGAVDVMDVTFTIADDGGVISGYSITDDPNWRYDVGFVPTVTQEKAPSSRDAYVILCGPPIMIKFTLPILSELGFPPERIIMSLEMRMKYGIGMCGRCNIGAEYVCKDGPVFSLAQLSQLPGEY